MWTGSDLSIPHPLSLFGSEEEIDRILDASIRELCEPSALDQPLPFLHSQTIFDAWLISGVIKQQRAEALAAELAAARLADEEAEHDDGDDLVELADRAVNSAAGKMGNDTALLEGAISRSADNSVNGATVTLDVGELVESLAAQDIAPSPGPTRDVLEASSSFSPSSSTLPVEENVENASTQNLSPGRFKHAADEGQAKGLVVRKGSPRWRDLGTIGRVLACNDGLALRHPERSAVTINLGREIMNVMDEKTAGWFGKRISRELKQVEQELGRELDFWFVLEIRTKSVPRPHFHGVITCSVDERPAVEEALQLAAGQWDSRRGEDHQIDWSEWDGPPDDGWVDYVTKNANDTRRTHPAGSIITASEKAWQTARASFDTWRSAQAGRA